MQFSKLALLAFASAVTAQGVQNIPESVINVLITALPAELLMEAATNPGAVYSDVAASISAGNTPSWYAALPTDVKNILAGQATAFEGSVPTATYVAQTTNAPAPAPTGSFVTSHPGSYGSYASSPSHPGSYASSPSHPGSSASGSFATQAPSGGAATSALTSSPAAQTSVVQPPTNNGASKALVGSGLVAGIVAFVGMLAL